MGGHALKKVVTRRYAREEYYQLKERILQKLQGHIDRYAVPKEFPLKESFGDLDVLLVCPKSVRINDLIEDLFHPNEIYKNGDVYSFDFEEFQVDFILTPDEHFDNAVVYLSYSDLGGLIGNICHKIGLKYGIQGLWMNVHTKEFDPTTTSTKLMLSTNIQQIFEFLGYDYEKYSNEFENEIDFFRWIKSSKYFRRFFFDDDQLNHAHRQRTSKRPIYIKFIDFLDKQQISDEPWSNEERDQFTRTVREQALIFFDKQKDYEKGLNLRDEKRLFRQKFSGHLFTDINGSKTMISVHIKNFQKRFAQTDEAFHQWVLDNDEQTIRTEVDKYKQELNTNSM